MFSYVVTTCSLRVLFTTELFGAKEKFFETTAPNAQARYSLFCAWVSWVGAGVLGHSSVPPSWWHPRRLPSLTMPQTMPVPMGFE